MANQQYDDSSRQIINTRDEITQKNKKPFSNPYARVLDRWQIPVAFRGRQFACHAFPYSCQDEDPISWRISSLALANQSIKSTPQKF